MNAVHPAFAFALNSICPPTTPPCPDGVYEMVYPSDVGDLICWFDHQERDTRYGCGGNESVKLTHAWVKDLNIFSRLDSDSIKNLEQEALNDIQKERQ